jgi:Ca2+-binding RTX toxin-like protein
MAAGFSALSPTSASALKTVTAGSIGARHVWITMVDRGDGLKQYVVYLKPSLADAGKIDGCYWVQIGNQFGLTDDVDVFGDSSVNDMYFVQSQYNYTVCGRTYTFRPIQHNGYWVDLHGAGGNDSLIGSTDPGSFLYGDGGHDTISARAMNSMSYVPKVFAGSGNDTLYALTANVSLEGNSGEDLFCLDTFYAHAVEALGGSEWDTRCGSAATMTDIQESSCANACQPVILW